MRDNPYQSPTADMQAVGVKSGKRVDVRSVAACQKGILVCILINMILFGCVFAVQSDVRNAFVWGIIACNIVGTISVFLLAMKVYHPIVGVVLGIITLVPCIGLLVLVQVNSKATNILQANGIKVGLMGAKLSDI